MARRRNSLQRGDRLKAEVTPISKPADERASATQSPVSNCSDLRYRPRWRSPCSCTRRSTTTPATVRSDIRQTSDASTPSPFHNHTGTAAADRERPPRASRTRRRFSSSMQVDSAGKHGRGPDADKERAWLRPNGWGRPQSQGASTPTIHHEELPKRGSGQRTFAIRGIASRAVNRSGPISSPVAHPLNALTYSATCSRVSRRRST